MNNIDIFREIGNANDALITWLEDRNQLFPVIDPNGVEHLFVENDVPRDAAITPLIMEATTGFALFYDDGKYIGSYRSLDRALAAKAGAKIVITPEVQGDEPDEDIMAEEPDL